jgi:hypothetical protein
MIVGGAVSAVQRVLWKFEEHEELQLLLQSSTTLSVAAETAPPTIAR